MKMRSLLIVPADRPESIATAHLTNADVVILDMEESVAEENRGAARKSLADSIAVAGQSGAYVFVRINPDKMGAMGDARAAVFGDAFGVVVPGSCVGRLNGIDTFLSLCETNLDREPTQVIALIEDPQGLIEAPEISGLNRVLGMGIGGLMLSRFLGAQPDRDILSLPKQMVHIAAKSTGQLSFVGLRASADKADMKAIEAEAMVAKRFGIDGAGCVDAAAVPVYNAAFDPGAAELEWANSIIKMASENDNFSPVTNEEIVDGRLVARAYRILDMGAE